MRTFEEVKKEQDRLIFELGIYYMLVEQRKVQIQALAKEAEMITSLKEENNGQSEDSSGAGSKENEEEGSKTKASIAK